MKKKYIFIFVICLLIVSAIGMSVVFAIGHKAHTFKELNSVDISQIQKISIQNSGYHGITVDFTDKQKIKEIYDILNSLSYKKSFNQKPKMGWSYSIKLFDKNNIEQGHYTFAGTSVTNGKDSKYYDVNKNIINQFDNITDWKNQPK